MSQSSFEEDTVDTRAGLVGGLLPWLLLTGLPGAVVAAYSAWGPQPPKIELFELPDRFTATLFTETKAVPEPQRSTDGRVAAGCSGIPRPRGPTKAQRHQQWVSDEWDRRERGSFRRAARALSHRRIPDQVRVAAFVDAFTYEYGAPPVGEPLAVHAFVAPSPWDPDLHVLRVGLQVGDVALHDLDVHIAFDAGAVSSARRVGFDHQDGSDLIFSGTMGARAQVTVLYEMHLHDGVGPIGVVYVGSTGQGAREPVVTIGRGAVGSVHEAPVSFRAVLGVSGFARVLLGEVGFGRDSLDDLRGLVLEAASKDPQWDKVLDAMADAETVPVGQTLHRCGSGRQSWF